MSSDWAVASAWMRRLSRGASTGACEHVSPSASAPSTVVRTSAVETSVFDGTQSVRTQAPPIPSRSTRVTPAPSSTATSAAS